MSKLRERFIRDLSIQNYSDRTIKSYVGSISLFARHYNTCPSDISEEEIKEYIAKLKSEGKSWSTVNLFISALNKLFIDTLDDVRKIERVVMSSEDRKKASVCFITSQ